MQKTVSSLFIAFSNWYGVLWPPLKISGCVSLATVGDTGIKIPGHRSLSRLGSNIRFFYQKKSILWDLLAGEINKSLFWVFVKIFFFFFFPIRKVITNQRIEITICLFHRLCKNQQIPQYGFFFWWKSNIRGILWA